MLAQKISQEIVKILNNLDLESNDLVLSIPSESQFGDYSTNIALQQSKQQAKNIYQSPREIAKAIGDQLETVSFISSVEVAGPGFINIKVDPKLWSEEVLNILSLDHKFGTNQDFSKQKVQVEFISANPTGPLTLANGRGGAIGDSLANIFEANGYQVEREYYVNDTGNQVRTLGESVLAAAGRIEAQDAHYQGGYVKELAEQFKDDLDLDPQTLGHKLADYMFENQIKPAISRLGIKFDNYFSERSLYPDQINQTVTLLEDKDLVYNQEGALWFKSTQYGDDKDRVLMTSEQGRGRQEPTYFLADIAHHRIIHDQGVDLKINILGADHHSYAERFQAMMTALYSPNWFQPIIMQLVRLYSQGQEVRMSKRAGTYVTLDELLDEISADAVRWFFLMKSTNTHLDFDLDLAKKNSNDNPVYYVQYAHARMANILAKVESSDYQTDNLSYQHPKEIKLIKHLTNYPNLVQSIAKDYQVHHLTTYLTDLADTFHQFYEQCPVLNAEAEEIKLSRLALVRSAQIVIANGLGLLGISAPDRM